MDLLISRIEAIAQATGSQDTQSKIVNEGEKVDEFIMKKRALNLVVREIRNDLEEKDAHSSSADGQANQPEIMRKTNAIRVKIRDARSEAAALREMVERERARLDKKGKSTEAVEKRFKVVDLIDAHLDECDRHLKGLPIISARDNPKKRALLKGAQFRDDAPIDLVEFAPSKASETELEDIDGFDEWQLQIQEGEQLFEEKQEMVLQQVIGLKHLARRLGEESEVVSLMVNDTMEKADKTQDKLDNANSQAKKVQEKLATKSNCCIDVFLFLVIVVLTGYLIWKYA